MKYHFDKKAANNAVNFIESHVRHTRGEWGGTLIKLEKWQKEDILFPIFGMKREDGFRKYRTAYIEIPRKNTKSTMAAMIALCVLVTDKEPGAQIYCAANDKDQARLIHEDAKEMIRTDAGLNSYLKIWQNSITYGNSFYKPLSSEAFTKDGLNTHLVIIDELHAFKTRELYDVLVTSQGSRRQPLTIIITTAGSNRNSICWEQHDYALKVRDGIIKDESFLPVIYCADPEDDIFSEKTWKKANPNYGVSVKPEYIKQEAKKARHTPGYENTFRRLHLNQWTTNETKWISDEVWMQGDEPFEIENGAECWGGLDLASVSDISAFSLVFQRGDKLAVLWWFWLPEDAIFERNEKHGVPYPEWTKTGFIKKTPGNVTDYNFIKKDVMEICEMYNVKNIAYDRWNASQLVNDLVNEGIEMSPYGQGFASMSTPTKELEKRILAKEILHGGNPVARWMLSNVMIKRDPADNIKVDKAKSTEKVDGIVSMIMAMGIYMAANMKLNEGKSIYEERGVLSL